jgi:putative transposase
MKKVKKDFVQILPPKKERSKMFKTILEEKIREKVKEVLEEVALLEREAFCEEQQDRKNGFYERDLETPLGTIAGLSIPRTRGKGFRPFFLEPYKRTLYTLDELITAMYQGGCSTRDITRTLLKSILQAEEYACLWRDLRGTPSSSWIVPQDDQPEVVYLALR